MTTIASPDWRMDIPGPEPVPLLGWLPRLIRFVFNPLSTLESLRRQYGNMVRLGVGKHSVILIFDPEYNRHILRDPSVFYTYDLELVPVPFPKDSSLAHVTTGMPLMNGPRHNDHRSALLPYFHRKFIARYHDACVDATERKLASWKIGAVVDLRTEMEQLAMWLATVPVLGLDPEEEGEAIGRQLERTMKLLFNPLALLFPYNVPGFPYHSLLKSGEEMERVVRKVIERKKAEGLKGDDILSAMIQMRQQDPDRISEHELIGHTATMFRGGYNPNGMVLYWAIFLLGQHPNTLKKVLAELAQTLREDIPTTEQIENLPYLEGVIKETMRLFPAGTWTARLAMQPFELNSHSLPKGTWVVMSPYVTHRIPEVFPEPNKFLPERWLSIHPSAYEFMPFSGGPRYCIGMSLGLMQLKIALAIILQRYALTLRPGTVVTCEGLNAIRPKNGLPMILSQPGEEPHPTAFEGNVKAIVEFS